ncbi:MAG: hypothetical protein EPO21_04225 [Chloroflexota bacterium]|nr:MAG: hypothetical protein EPO21_04225 [Chloroflexota bacterium]
MFKFLLIGVIVLGLGIGAAFGAGTAYGRSSGSTLQAAKSAVTVNSSAASGAGGPNAGTNGQAVQTRPGVIGTIESVTGNSFTVKTSGGTTSVKVDDKTTIRKTVTGTAQDLTPGETVVIAGETGSDGTVSAASVALGDNTMRLGQMGSGQGQMGGSQGQGGARQNSRQ